MEKTDYQLVQEYLEGNEAAFEELTRRYLDAIYAFVIGYVKDSQAAQDVTQNVFLKVWKNLRKIKKDKSIKSWIYTIAKNSALDWLKSKKSLPFSRFETSDGRNPLADSLPGKHPLPDARALLIEQKDIITQAIEALSAKYRQVLTMYYYQDLKFREIAIILQEPLNTVKSRHRRGLLLLEKKLRQN